MTPVAGDPSPLDRPLVVVIGKGGVGKSTVAAALAVSAARRGRRPIVVEVAGRNDIPRLVAGADSSRPHAERPPAERVHHLSIDPSHALADYLHEQLPAGPLATLLTHSRSFGLLAAAAPGLSELVTIGKVWSLTRPRRGHRGYDVVVLDAPATGHGGALLSAPSTFSALVARGPVRHQAEEISAFLTDPARTAVVAVTTAEQMAVHETLDLRELLRSGPGLAIERVVVDRLRPVHFSARELRTLHAAKPCAPIRAALFAASLAAHQRAQLRWLAREMTSVPIDTLPFVFESALGPAAIAGLADELERQWAAAAAHGRPDAHARGVRQRA